MRTLNVAWFLWNLLRDTILCVFLHLATLNACQRWRQCGTCVRCQWENNGAKIYSGADYATLKVVMTDNENAKDNVSVCSWQIFDCSRLLHQALEHIKYSTSMAKRRGENFFFLLWAKWFIVPRRNLFSSGTLSSSWMVDPENYFAIAHRDALFIASFFSSLGFVNIEIFNKNLEKTFARDRIGKVHSFSFAFSTRLDISPQLIKYLIAKVYNHHPSHLHPFFFRLPYGLLNVRYCCS